MSKYQVFRIEGVAQDEDVISDEPQADNFACDIVSIL
jgi:hypothetical protein